MPTIRDLAQEAGVGIGTASRVLSGSPRVAAETRARVHAAMERLGYRPSRVARALSKGRTQTLEVMVPLFTRYFYVEVLRGIEAALVDTDYALLIRTIERATDRDRAFEDPCPRGRADGVLIVSLTPTAKLLEQLSLAECRAVLVDSDDPRLSNVTVDHAAAAASAVRHLIALGHRRIASIDHPEDPFAPAYPGGRHKGYRRALAEAGIPPRPEYELMTDFSPEAGAGALDSLLALPEPPTAVFVGSDTQAFGVLEAARRRGLRVPEDLAVVGYNDIELAQYLGLTSVRVPMREMGQRGVELLLAALHEPDSPPTQVRLPAQLVVRRTCGAREPAS